MENNKETTIFSERLRQKMWELHLRNIDLAEALNIPKSSVSMYLNANTLPKPELLTKIANYLDVNEAWLAGYDIPQEGLKEKELITIKEGKILDMYRALSEDDKMIIQRLLTSLSKK